MWVKIHANYRFIKQIQKTRRLICSSHRGINFMFYSITISDRLNCKVVGGLFQCNAVNITK